jgi:membrane-bound lytic murein transglycosylase B
VPRPSGSVTILGMRPAATAISAVQRRVEDAVLAAAEDAIDRAIAQGLVERIVERLLAEGIVERTVDRVFDERQVVDEVVKRLIESEALWVLVDEIAQSPAVTEAIGRQSIGFADQVAGEVRNRSRRADARLERVARRALRRPV